MITNNISVSEFKVGFDDRFNVKSNDWQPRLNKWLVKAMTLVNSFYLYNPVAINLAFEDGVLHMPVDISIITGIVYNGIRLSPIDFIPFKDVSQATTEHYYLLGTAKGDGLIVDPNERPIEVKLPTTTVVTSDKQTGYTNYTYTVLRNDIIQLNLPDLTGSVTLFYKSLPYKLQQNGVVELLIPDNEELIEAMEWYILMRLIGRGYIHHTFKYGDVEARWRDGRRRANISIGSMSADQRERVSHIFRNFLSDYDRWYKLS